jgi:acetyl-CoA C-acetyltransferase
MSNAPHLLKKSRGGYKFGDFPVDDSIVCDGLTDAFSKIKMGHCAEKTAKETGITREAQDAFCLSSYKKALATTDVQKHLQEIVPVGTSKGKVDRDEEPTRFAEDRIKKAKLAFTDKTGQGTVTTANASKINDGACVLILASETGLKRLGGVKPLARFVSYGDAEVPPADFNRSPPKAAIKALDKAGLKPSEMDLWEINEAFSVTALYFAQELQIAPEKVNVFGGAVALGHPLGMSGARVLLSLINALVTRGGRMGCAAICNGGGGSSAVVLERVN